MGGWADKRLYTAGVSLSRAVTLVLAVLVSPLGTAVCEVVCGAPGHAAAHAAAPAQTVVQTDQHAHHDHHAHHAPAAAPVIPPASDADGRMHVPGPECDPVLSIPGRVRSPFFGPDLHAAVVTHLASVVDTAMPALARVVVSDTGPPDPPRHAPIPLRI